MQELIPFVHHSIGEKIRVAVSARELHEKLGIKKPFTQWLEQYTSRDDWHKDNDFSVFTLEVKNPVGGGRPGIDAALSVQMAEHIAMMTRTVKGREIREYFRQARDERDAHPMLPQVKDPGLQMLIEMAVRTDEALTQAKQADARAIRAEAKADMALSEAHRMTVEHFFMSNGLLHQFPPAEHQRVSTWLKTFCLDYGLEVRKEPVYGKPWADENIYPLHAFSAWLRYEQLRPRQQTLRVLPQQDIP